MTLLHQAAQKAVEALTDDEIDAMQADCDCFLCDSCDIRVHEFARAVESFVLARAALQQQPEPVEWQWRWTNPANDRNPGKDVEWQKVEVRGGQSLEQRLGELRSYRYDDKPCYEVRALYTTPPALQHQEVPREPVAWLNPSSGKTCSADEKFSMENHQGVPGKAVAAHFSAPLYASPSTTRQQEVGND